MRDVDVVVAGADATGTGFRSRPGARTMFRMAARLSRAFRRTLAGLGHVFAAPAGPADPAFVLPRPEWPPDALGVPPSARERDASTQVTAELAL